jgi:multiple sugar transport system permease protein
MSKPQFERGILSSYDLKKPGNKVVYFLMYLVILLMICSMLYPISVILLNSLKANVEVNLFPPHYWPQEWHFENFRKAWNYIPLPKYLRNTLTTVVVIGFAAFALSILQLPYKKIIYYFFLVTLFIPPTTYIIPNFINLKDLGLMNSFAAFWLPAGANAFFLLLLKSFFDGLNKELFESGRMDGASDLRLYSQIAIPLSVPIIATLSIFVFASSWNDWYWPGLIMKGDHYPLATAINVFVNNARRLDLNVKFAILFMVTTPPVIVFLLFQRFIVRGVNLGGVKG